MKKIITIEGMHCIRCEQRVSTALGQLEKVKKVKVNLAKKEVKVEMTADIENEVLIQQIHSLGFQVVKIETK